MLDYEKILQIIGDPAVTRPILEKQAREMQRRMARTLTEIDLIRQYQPDYFEADPDCSDCRHQRDHTLAEHEQCLARAHDELTDPQDPVEKTDPFYEGYEDRGM